MARPQNLAPEDQFPKEAIKESVQEQPRPEEYPMLTQYAPLTLMLASVADNMPQWGWNVPERDRRLREFWPTEPFLAGAIYSLAERNSAYEWEIKSNSKAVVTAVTDMLTAAIAGESIGWVPFMLKFTQDLLTQDNGAFVEIIRDPAMDATSRFKGPMAPVIGIAHLDSNQCIRTGNAEYPVLYIDDHARKHKLAWYQVVPFSDFPSPIKKMNGVGYCGVTRSLRLAQIMKSIELYKDEKISGRHFKSIHIVSGVSRTELDDAKSRGREEANNAGQVRYIDPVILASLDPEKPVSTATIDLAGLPDNFNLDSEMQWYIAGLALDFGADYQDFAPLPGGNIGSSEQSIMLHRKSSGKGPRTFMRMVIEGFKNYGIIPRNASMQFNDKNEQEELEKQTIRTKALEEAAIAVNSNILTPQAAAEMLVERGIYTQDDISSIPDTFWQAAADSKSGANDKNMGRGGNTLAEDAGRTDAGKQQAVGERIAKFFKGD